MQEKSLTELNKFAESFFAELQKQVTESKNTSLQQFLTQIIQIYGSTYAAVFLLFSRLNKPQVNLQKQDIIQLQSFIVDCITIAKLIDNNFCGFDEIKNKILHGKFVPVLPISKTTQESSKEEIPLELLQQTVLSGPTDVYEQYNKLESISEDQLAAASFLIDSYSAQYLSKTERNQGSYFTDEQRGNLIEKVKVQKTTIASRVELDVLQDLNQRVSLVEKFGQKNVQAFGGHFAKSDVEKITELSKSPEKKDKESSLRNIIQHIDKIAKEMQLPPVSSQKTQAEISNGYRRQLNLHLEKIASLLKNEDVKAVYGHEIIAEINTRIQMLKLANSVAIAFNKYLHERAFDWHLFADVLRGNNPNNHKTLQGRANFVDAIKEKFLSCDKPQDFVKLAKFINERIAMLDKPGSRVIRLLKPIMQRLNQIVQTSNMPKEIKEQVAREHQVQFFDQKLLLVTRNYYQDRASKLKFSLFDKHKKILLDRAEMVQGLENILKQNALDATDEVKMADNYVKYVVTVLTLLENDSLNKSKLREPLLKNVNEILRLIAKNAFPKFNPQQKLIVQEVLAGFLRNQHIKPKEKKIIQPDLLKHFGLNYVDEDMSEQAKTEISRLVSDAQIKRQPLKPEQKMALFQYELQAGLSNAILASKVIMSGKITVNNDEQLFAIYDFGGLEDQVKKIGTSLAGIAKKIPKVFGVDVGDLASEQLAQAYKQVTSKVKGKDMKNVFERNGNLAKSFNLISRIDEFVIGVTNRLLQIYAPQILALEQSHQNKDSVKAFAKALSQSVIKLLESGDIKGKNINEVMENMIKAVGSASDKFSLKIFGQALRETSVLSNTEATTIEGFMQQSGVYDPETGKYYMPKNGTNPLKYGFRIGNRKALGLGNFQEIANTQDPAIVKHKNSIETALRESKELLKPSENQPQQEEKSVENKQEETKTNGNNSLPIESEKVQLLEEKLVKTENQLDQVKSELNSKTQEVGLLNQRLVKTEGEIDQLKLQLEMQQQQTTQIVQMMQIMMAQKNPENQPKNLDKNSESNSFGQILPTSKSGYSLEELKQKNNNVPQHAFIKVGNDN